MPQNRLAAKGGMSMKRTRSKSKPAGKGRGLARSVLLLMALTAALCAIGAALVMGGILPQNAIPAASAVALGLAALFAGAQAARQAGEKKLLWALLPAACVLAALLVLSLIVFPHEQSAVPVTLIAALPASALGCLLTMRKKRAYARHRR